MFRAIRNRLFFGRPIYVWKSEIQDKPGFTTLGFTYHRRGAPLFKNDRGWRAFKPNVFPFGFPTDNDYQYRGDTWCRIGVTKMLMEVQRNGFYIAEPKRLVVRSFSTFQAFPTDDPAHPEYVATRYAYIWEDQDPSVLPTTLNGLGLLEPWKEGRLFDVCRNPPRLDINFWKIQYDLEIFKYHVEPYTPKLIVGEAEQAKAEQERLAALECERSKTEWDKFEKLQAERLKAIEDEQQRLAKNEQRKTEWPYNASWWPRNGLQTFLFMFVVLFVSVLVAILVAGSSGSPLFSLMIFALLSLPPAFAVGMNNPYFYEATAIPPEPVRPAPPPQAPAPPPPPIRKLFEERLRTEIMEHDFAIPPPEVMNVILSVGEAIYNTSRATPHAGPRPGEGYEQQVWDALQAKWEKADELVFEAVVQSLSAYISHLPTFDSAPFTTRLGSTSVSGSAINDIMRPFTFNHALKELGLAKSLTDRFNANVGAYTDSVKKPPKTLWPQRYQGKPGDIVPTYLQGTPVQILFDVLVPYNPLSDEMRFTHHWCMGDNGAGKTTYLSHLIKHDLDRVARDECSLVVLDSKKLVRDMRTLKQFAHELDGRLILIDADAIFPLNPFKLPKARGLPILVYMLAGLTEASKLQLGVLRHYVNAAYTLDNPSLYTLCDLMQAPKDKLPAQLDPERLDDTTRKWFTHTRKTVASLTSGGIEQRLLDFLSEFGDSPFLKMLTADRFALDMPELDHGGTVLLVDANRGMFGKEAGNILGRLIIALVDQLSTARTQPGAKYKPLFVYIDEAQDYIAKDEIFADILEKARASEVGMLVAHHHLKQGGGFLPGVVAALEQAGIHSRCLKRGQVEIVKSARGPFTIPIRKPLDFDKEDQMRREEYAALRERLAAKYPYAHSSASPPPARPRGNGKDRFDRP